jgi:arylformamidase
MILKTIISGRETAFDTQNPIELTLPVQQGPDTVNAYYIADAIIKPFAAGGFVGSKAMGGSCNCEDITFNAHGNGTHTECVGHISTERIALHQCLKEFLFLAELVTIQPDALPNGDFIITPALLQAAAKNQHPALIIRTLPNADDKKTKRYSGSNPTYLSLDAAVWIRNHGVKHLLIDTPSVDREEDEGALAAHHAFWQYPQNTRIDCTITELIYAPQTVADGQYVLNISVGAFDSDASPSRILLYPFID